MDTMKLALEKVQGLKLQDVQFQVEFEQAVRLRGIRAKHSFLAAEQLSSEPRGNEVDLRKQR